MRKKITIDIKCTHCKKDYTVKADAKNYILWKNGTAFIQDLLPELTAGERELLISNTCDACWLEIFGPDDSDNEEDS